MASQEAVPNEPLTVEQQATEAKLLGNQHFRNKQFALALAQYSLALTLTPSNPVLLLNQSAGRHALGDYVGALEDADLALKLDPGREKAFVRKARALESLQRFPEARVAMEDCVKANPKSSDEHREYLKELVAKDDGWCDSFLSVLVGFS